MKKTLLVAFSTAALLTIATACNPYEPILHPTLPKTVLSATNSGYFFTAGSDEGFVMTPYSTAYEDGGILNPDGEHLCIWITNADRAKGAGWFWGGWDRNYYPATNLYGFPPLGKIWSMAIKIRSTNSPVLHDLRPLYFRIQSTNILTGRRGTLIFSPSTIVPVSDTLYIIDTQDFTLLGSMGSVQEALESVKSLGFDMDNSRYLDDDSFGFIIDSIAFGYR